MEHDKMSKPDRLTMSGSLLMITEMTKESRERRESPKSFTQRRMWTPVFECGGGCEA